jgi:tetratricopeptide (TPR) repeat protein
MNTYRSEFDRISFETIERLTSSGLDAAKEYAFSLSNQNYRELALEKIAVALAEQSRPEGVSLFDTIERPLERADAFISIGREYAKQRRQVEAKEAFMRAVSSAEAIPRRGWETPAIMVQASEGLYKLALVSEAMSFLSRAIPLAQAETDVESVRTLANCAVLLAEWGHREEANSILETITLPGVKAHTYERIQQLPQS